MGGNIIEAVPLEIDLEGGVAAGVLGSLGITPFKLGAPCIKTIWAAIGAFMKEITGICAQICGSLHAMLRDILQIINFFNNISGAQTRLA